MKPVENYIAEDAFKRGKIIFILNKETLELLILSERTNPNFLSGVFVDAQYIFYVGE